MVSKILSIIDSCKRAEQIETCMKWIDIIALTPEERLTCIGAMQLKIKQLQNAGWSKITGENRFPCDDEHREKQEPPQSDGPY